MLIKILTMTSLVYCTDPYEWTTTEMHTAGLASLCSKLAENGTHITRSMTSNIRQVVKQLFVCMNGIYKDRVKYSLHNLFQVLYNEITFG